MLALGKNGEGIIHGILTFPSDDHYRPSNATRMHDLCAFSGCLVGKTDKARHCHMKQIANLVVVAIVFTRLMVCNVCIVQSERGGAYTRDIN